MNKINKDEMFGNLKSFLKSKGIELQKGTYTERIRQGCGVLAESINVSQDALKQTKAARDKGLEQLRHVIHQQTAPKQGARTQANSRSNAKSKSQKSAANKPAAAKRGARKR